MLDLNHALTPFVFEAARYEDEIRRRLVAFPAASPDVREQLLREILAGPLPELRRLLRERFNNRPGIARKLDAIESAVQLERPIDELWAAFSTLDGLSKDTFGTAFI